MDEGDPMPPTAGPAEADRPVDVAAYLRRMIHYATSLARGDASPALAMPPTPPHPHPQQHQHLHEQEGGGERLIDALARELLLAADPYNLRSSLPVPDAFLPAGWDDDLRDADADADAEHAMSDDDATDDDNEEEGEDDLPYRIHPRKVRAGRPRRPARVDALRSLLRCLAPVAMDVGTRAACHALAADRSDGGTPGDAPGDGASGGADHTESAEGRAIRKGGEQLRLRAFVLFGHWLPLAPQLAPLASDLFVAFGKRCGRDACPLALLPLVSRGLHGNNDAAMQSDGGREGREETADAEAAAVAAEAAHELLDAYCFRRCEHAFVRGWWEWDSSLFVLIRAGDDLFPPKGGGDACDGGRADATDADGDAVMESDEGTDATHTRDGRGERGAKDCFVGGYSPDTDAPHCRHWKHPLFQTRWHAARAVGSLFALRPLPLARFLQSLGAFEREVPFVRHPWTVHEEEAAWEVRLMRGVGRAVLPRVERVKIAFGREENGARSFVRGDAATDAAAKREEDALPHDEHEFPVPTSEESRRFVPLHPALVHAGRGILLPRRGSVASYDQWRRSSLAPDAAAVPTATPGSDSSFIPTPTTAKNMTSLGIALASDPHPPPILVCGPPGAGKSSLVRELARRCSSFAPRSREDALLELHVDDETDAKSLLGAHVATDVPGEFVWRAGPLTLAARTGRWVLIEDVDRCPEEIQAALIRLFEERIVPLGVGREEKCHPGFRLFGTCATSADPSAAKGMGSRGRRRAGATFGAGGKRILHPQLWRRVHVDPLPFAELREVGRRRHPDLPHSVADAALNVLRKLDKSGRGDEGDDDDAAAAEGAASGDERGDAAILGHGARPASVREYVKLLSRISAAATFEPGTDYATESQRLLCLAETVDVFALSCPSPERRREFTCRIAAPTWGLTADAATRYVEGRIPSLSRPGHDRRYVAVGRARLAALRDDDATDASSAPGTKRTFAETNHARRLMESVAVCAAQNEPALLVGETGCGKTTLVQRLAALTGRTLLVQNLSLQTDSTDLLGGYRPLELRHAARGVYDQFVDLFVSSFSRSQNAQFLKYVLTAFEKGEWKRLAQCFLKAAGMGENKIEQMRELSKKGTEPTNLEAWSDFRSVAERFDRQRIASESGLAFLFTEGALVDAIRTGKWVLLDEINLASSETLQRLCGLLDDSHGSITLTEKGDAEAVNRHPDFRLFAAMNPATDAGKKDLPASIRSRFTEIYVDELVDPVQLRSVAARYLDGAVATSGVPLEHSESVMSSVDLYLQCRLLSDQSLVDGGGQKPRYTMRTLCRTLSAARNLIIQQRFAPQRAILEGFQLAFEGSLDLPSRKIIQKQFTSLLPKGISHKERDHPGRRPDGKKGNDSFVLIKPFWIKSGKGDQLDWADPSASSTGKPKFVLTQSATSNLRRLCQAVASGPWSILLEGPTSAGKTTLVEYLAARCGHRCVRINNHEHTDIQEYTGSYAADSKGKISFQEGILVQALRKGHWIILDELNLAPSEVLEALNRLLDDNRELYLAEINEVVKPHPNFRLFATQNPAGAYGGRKPLSRAFRNRFVEIHMSDIPEDEMITILERRCGCPPSHAKLLVKVMKSLRQRRSRTGIFRGKDGLITPRDLLRWAGRGASTKQELAMEGYMLLAERLRIDEEKEVVRGVIEKELKVTIGINEAYYGEKSDGRVMLEHALGQTSSLSASGVNVNSIAPTASIMRLLTLVMRCVKQKEPVLLVGDTGCGKTTVVQLLSVILRRQLTVVNCHASTETSDLLGGFRPVRGRQNIVQTMIAKAADLVRNWTDATFRIDANAPPFIVEQAQCLSPDVPSDSPKQVVQFVRELAKKCGGNDVSNTESPHSAKDKLSSKKRRKLSNGKVDSDVMCLAWHCQLVAHTHKEIESLYQKYLALFEWADGPLVCSMKEGSLLLLDEMSLAEDAILERLNSVLEPSRTLTLAEKGGEGPSCVHESDGSNQALSSEIFAHEDFRIFATMNPGGDFGKRELSPALRSRFTEIWVPAVSQRADIDLVLERSFSSVVEPISLEAASILSGLPELRQMMLDYFEWFNVAICDDPNSFCNDFKLSLRDVLSWARFVADVSLKAKTVDLYAAYVHGASLMHLDGLGLGTGVSNHDAAATRNKAKAFLLRQISEQGAADVVGFEDELRGIEESMVSTEDNFGVVPFTITTGHEEIPSNLGFNLTAPTTGLNLRRVLRGMQIAKPILLEGSPGVGKTSLITALAKASGHHLVRINLSEQTDISDLMGSDLPYSGEDAAEGAASASFRWCDGVLLKAIKRGDWVLLDELNLASQSVLEGLNSCLDHRASVYIPELGRTFACPPTFRIFAAQNPLAQGGGRKGLPKSFLNRFTKVYIEALTKDDLFSICVEQFPSVPTDIVEKMINFNEEVQRDIDSRQYGQHGSPWEFNLRDIFRWSQLLISDEGGMSSQSAAKYADMLYTQRLRTEHDRACISKQFRDSFDGTTGKWRPKLEVTSSSVTVGTTTLERFSGISHWSDVPTQDSEPGVAQSLLRPMEAVACCVRMNWPCLLVGPASSGKSALLKTLADACNVHIETLAMTSSTDVTELIGCFEQTDAMGCLKDVLKSLKRVYNGCCLSIGIDTEMLRDINVYFWRVHEEALKLGHETSLASNKALVLAVEQLVKCFEDAARLVPEFSASFHDQISSARKWLASLKRKPTYSKAQSPFRWVDGILVQAMERGYWLHLENVNFCPSSVLDRLNPLMEFGGELVMTECGVSDEDENAKPRVVKPHPNFRLFLSMNPSSHGEVSRAMRNRCIEVCVLPLTLADESESKDGDKVEVIDAFTALWDSGLRSHNAGQRIIASHLEECQKSTEMQEEPHSVKTLKDWGSLFTGLLKRGMCFSSFNTSQQILYEMHHSDQCQRDDPLSTLLPSALVTGVSSRRDLALNLPAALIAQQSRLLKVMSSATSNVQTLISPLKYFNAMKPHAQFAYTLGGQQPSKLLFQSICRLLETTPFSQEHVASYFDGFCTDTATRIKFALQVLNGGIEISGSAEQEQPTPRASHLLEESVTYHELCCSSTTSAPTEMNVLAVSYYLHKKRIDTSAVSCPVTPLLFPLFHIMDNYLSTLQLCKSVHSAEVLSAHDHFLLCRDRFWQCLKREQYVGLMSHSGIGFQFSGFLIQYCWVKKSFTKFKLCMEREGAKGRADSAAVLSNLLLSFETIDEAIQESTGGSISSTDILWKKGGHPVLPSKLSHFEHLSSMKDISDSCALASDDLVGFTKMVSSPATASIDLNQLIASQHPSLFTQKAFKKELLGALATAFWATTDEARGAPTKPSSVSSAPKVLRKILDDHETEFAANIHLATIDTSIRTVDNALDMEAIKDMVGNDLDQKQASDVFLSTLMVRFADIQAAQIGETWCIAEEEVLIGKISQILRQHQMSAIVSIAEELQGQRLALKSFISKALEHTQWPVSDLRPYQTLLWALESEATTDDGLLHILRSILPRMAHSLYSHQWCNTFNDLESVSSHLVGPSLWNKDGSEPPNPRTSSILGQSAKHSLVTSVAGPTRVESNVSRAAVFHLLQLPPASDSTTAYLTMENGGARRAQAKKLLPLFASRGPPTGHVLQAETIKYLLGVVVDAFKDALGPSDMGIKTLLDSQPMKTSAIAAALLPCENKRVHSLFNNLGVPLIDVIQTMNEIEVGSRIWKRHLSMAWIHIGLLRLHLLVPSSPIDPGRRPVAKVEQLDWFLGHLSSNLLSHSLHCGLSHGDFAPDSPSTRQLTSLAETATRKRSNQEKKIIERPPNAPPFQDLFREIHHFCKTVANPTNVLGLAGSIESSDRGSNFRSQEVNWQCSATSFCRRLATVYSVYEDITMPVINEIGAIQRGLRHLALNQAGSPRTRLVVETQDELLKYPLGNDTPLTSLTKECYSSALKDLLLRVGADPSSARKQDPRAIHRSIQMAALLRLQIDQTSNHRGNVHGDTLAEVNSIFSSLARVPEGTDSNARSNEVINETEREEKEFREYFPNHGAEFEKIVASLDDDSFGGGDDMDADASQGEEKGADGVDQLSDAEMSLIVSMHEELFSQRTKKADDSSRIRAFVGSYEAASHLSHLTEWMPKSQGDDSSTLGSHLFALALRCNVSRSAWSSAQSNDSIRHFHSDPFPSEAMMADSPLRNLLIRVGQLLRAFPGHAILVALGQVVERVRQLDIQVVSLGKVMSGLEVILRKAQDWEQHASQHVSLGKPLKDISSLVAAWRKLELQSWSHLLTIREKRRSLRAKRHWPRVYSLVHQARESGGTTADKPTANHASSPQWVWKGCPKISTRAGADFDTKSLDELAKVLDSFCLTSDMAEFEARLGLIESFANELRNECSVNGATRLPLARLLQSLCNHYSRFAPLLMQSKDKLREPIEKRLKDEVKLAKWDEQSYYSLAESSEKNHRKLMKFLRDYDEALDTSVLSILEQNFAEGVRSSDQTQASEHEPVTTVPGDSSLFPQVSRKGASGKHETLPASKMHSLILSHKGRVKEVSFDDWLNAGVTDSDGVDKYVLKIGAYSRRMESIIPRSNSPAYNAATIAADMTEAIFARIDALREPKTTKQVKQRALVDLFKCLKEQGYSSMKWSVPPSIRAPHAMLQLPVPSLENVASWDKSDNATLEKGESYFHRCQVEITRLRFECSMLGSPYMSQREMTLMQGYSEYILFLMCQQRCMIAKMIQEAGDIESLVGSYNAVKDGLPMGQKQFSNGIVIFEKHLLSLVEGLRQVILLMKESLPLVDSDATRRKVHDAVAVLTTSASTLEESYAPCCGKMPITSDQIDHIGTAMASLLCEAKSSVVACRQNCDGILPAAVFDACMNDVDQAIGLAHSFKEEPEGSKLEASEQASVQATVARISSLVQSTLIAVQSVCKEVDDDQSPADSDAAAPLCRNHKDMLGEWTNLRLEKIHCELSGLSDALLCLHDDASSNEIVRSLCTRATVGSFSLVHNVLQLSKARLSDALLFYQEHAKFLYVLLRVFRNLVAKGYCADDVSDGGEGDGEGGAGELKFEDDVEGTGMGEGDGKKDVTDELENEEQLLGLKGNENQEASSSQEKKELNEDEVDTGMEMENDFDGEKYDVPDQPEEQNDDANSENEEELDREMGDGDDPNEQVVDEKMWDDKEDDLEEMQQETEKFEENSKMKGEQLEDEMRTGDGEDEGDGQGKEDAAQEQTPPKDTPQDEGAENDADQLDEMINDDTEDKYEDKHGVEVRNEDQGASGDEEEDGGDEGVDFKDLNLDEGDEESGSADATGEDEENENPLKPDPEETPNADADNNPSDGEDDANEDEVMDEPDASDKIGGGGAGLDEEEAPDESDDRQQDDTPFVPPSKSNYETKDALGVAAQDGQDAVKEATDEGPDANEAAKDSGEAQEQLGVDENAADETNGAGGSGNDGNWQRGKDDAQNSNSQNEALDDVPNPFRSPGDAEKFWHKKLDMVQDSEQDQDEPVETRGEASQEERKEKDGQFEYTKEGEDSTGQVLGIAEEEQATQLEDHADDELDPSKQDINGNDMEVDGADGKREKRDQRSSSQMDAKKDNLDHTESAPDPNEADEQQVVTDDQHEDNDNAGESNSEVRAKTTNRATTDRTQLQDFASDDDDDQGGEGEEIQEMDLSEGITLDDLQQARAYWQAIQSDTNNLSRRLCEKLRLVMEPLVATKLRGDYRTGKRVNMKRIIGYIASGYRKDKIWLRRTKPAKRDYRVLIAVDDSESMQKSQAGDMALRALATLANGMSQLEIGQLGIASFGDDMKLLHPFNIPFTSESGVNVVNGFTFDAKRTRTALCVESSIAALEGASSVSSSMQLVFMISDGRIERDSRSKLRRLIRQMAEENMLMVMIIVEGEGNASKSNESILNMKEVSFVNGKPKIKHFIEDYPFPYYLIVGDLASLPEILGDALRQWFEMLATINAV